MKWQRIAGWRKVVVLGALAFNACGEHSSAPMAVPEGALRTTEGEIYLYGEPTYVDGVAFYEYEGEWYPPEGTQAKIWRETTTGEAGSKRGKVQASFDFRGNSATQSTRWILASLTGSRLMEGNAANYGARTGWLLTRTDKRYSGGFSIAHQYACDIKLDATTDHLAWYLAFTIKEVGNQFPMLSVGRGGERPAYSQMATSEYPCYDDCTVDDDDPDDPGDGEFETMLSPTGTGRLNCDGGGGGGGGGTEEPNCYEMYEFWYDQYGVYHEKFILAWCEDGTEWET